MASKVDVNDPQVRRLVYNMYRGMLGNYNSKANDYIGTLPKDKVKADQGISKQIESMIRQSSQISGGGSPSPGGATDGPPVNAAPSFPVPPPPPPPGPSGSIPTVRLNTEIPDRRGKEPPAAIQNAMMSKDKKPFTYTPGGIDLSQIRSPRMARRIERNAAAEGVTEVPKTQPPPANHAPPVAGSTPQMAVPVFPPAPPPPPPMGPHTMAGPPPICIPKNPVLRPTGLRHDKPDTENVGVPPPPNQPAQSYVPPPQPQITPAMLQRQPLHEVPIQQNQPATTHFGQRQPPSEPPSPQQPQQYQPPPQQYQPPQYQQQPGSIYVPPVTPTRSQTGSLYIPPIGDTQDSRDSPRQTPAMSPPPSTPTIASPVKLAKAPTPWMSRQREEPQVPAWAAREEPTTPSGGTRIIPIQIEGRDPPQQQQQQQQRQQQQQQQQHVIQQQRQQQQQQQQQPPGTRIIPIQVEGAAPAQSYQQQQQQQQTTSPRPRVAQPVYVHNKFNPTSPPPQQECYSPAYERQQSQGWPAAAPIQSRSFKVLQKITDTDRPEEEQQQPEVVHSPIQQQQQQQDYHWGQQQQQQQWGPQNTQGVPISQLRKLELSEDDRALMNKFKAQVDEDSSLHSESDPRYRGAAIPSRAFRILQSMTDTTGEIPQAQVPRGPPTAAQPRVQPVQAEQAPQPYIPASEQQVQEPRKYTGGAIPSRSFRMLQAMTAPENCAPGQSDM